MRTGLKSVTLGVVFVATSLVASALAASKRGPRRELVSLKTSRYEVAASLPVDASRTGWQQILERKMERDVPLIHEAWRSHRPPYGVFDTITLHRLVRKSRGDSPRPEKVVFMLPGTWGTGGWSEIVDANANAMMYLADNGYDVYTMDFRSANVPAMDYDQFAQKGIDLSTTADWTLGVYRDDIDACVAKIRAESGAQKIFLTGFSRGTGHMAIYASKYPENIKGLIFLDGFIKNYPPSGTPMDQATFAQVVQLFKSGQLTDPTSGAHVQWVIGFGYYTPNYASWKLAGVMPYVRAVVGGPLPAGYGDVSEFVADDASHLWDSMGQGPGLFTNYHGGYIERDLLVKELNEFNPYYPNIQALEEMQLEAHGDVPYLDYDDNEIDLPALSFHSAFSCPNMTCLDPSIPNWTKNADVTSYFLDGYGHIDVLFGTNSAADVKGRMLDWLNARAK